MKPASMHSMMQGYSNILIPDTTVGIDRSQTVAGQHIGKGVRFDCS